MVSYSPLSSYLWIELGNSLKFPVNKMKANNGKGNIVERDNWETPQWFFDILHKQYKFDLDCCATKENRKVSDYSNNFIRFAGIVNHNILWMNPPFSKAKEMFKRFFEVVEYGVAIYRCDNLETSIWQDIILKNADWIFFPKGRINYEGMEGKGSRFPSALIGVGVDIPKGLNGKVLKVLKTGKI